MKRNTPNAYYTAYSWSKMDNGQRHEVVKFFEREYGLDFAHKAKFGLNFHSFPKQKTPLGVGKGGGVQIQRPLPRQAQSASPF